LAREALGMGSASDAVLDVRAADWWLRGVIDGGRLVRMVMHAAAREDSGLDALDLVQVPLKPPAVHGVGGVSRKGDCVSCASHYYSFTRLRTTGTLVYRGVRMRVSGLTWMDHEFGSSELQADQVGWDWFSVQLDDGRELMLYLLRQRDGSVTRVSSGSLIERDGRVRYLPLSAFSVQTTAHWRSPHSGGDYPSAWRVRVPGAGVDVVLMPTVADQELAAVSGGVSYWEGAVGAFDPASPGRSLGAGYVELTGYAGRVSL
jgi:predicted secreted hydrolase